MSRERLYGGIEAGGTKFVCATATDSGNVTARAEFPTTAPGETIDRALGFFEEQAGRGRIAGIGIASFGPVDLNPASPHFGYITSTPKKGWRNVDLAGPVRQTFQVPVAFDTDVNAAALGEQRWGAARGLDTFVYVTVGTGIGGGGMAGGRSLHGMLHPEMGHMRIAHDLEADPFAGVCPFHGDCLEGLASGPAIEARWGGKGQALPDDHAAWKLEAHYLALGVNNLVCALSPQRIILGGGVMRQASLFPLIRRRTLELLNQYIQTPEIAEHIDKYLVPPKLGDNAGVLGAIALALEAAPRR
ncbi:MAG TPA: ROK family protein [Terriglobia bacterium]|nr:ROK family protein [Terriglobia bacterium]